MYFKFKVIFLLLCYFLVNINLVFLVVFGLILCKLDFRKNIVIVMDNIL